ncbi:tetratricopeptide repeat protein [Acetobacter sp. AN02]|uniref:tetratricopeptide repeat protein n=1 Tax=Acetobacter sp. AN02 TaxID=2894186 RepID=UPI00243424D3|nr:tetratricopeptide repeat protein [Acetobacter sp. AN02]MDG6095828.1 tetratricopeptide repeat protein [Acetobacter sp. AN02]
MSISSDISGHPPDSGEALQIAGRLEEARAAYLRALEQKADDPRLLSNYGGLLFALGEFREASGILMKAVALKADFPDAWSNLGNTFLQLQKYGEAIDAYTRCLRLQPGHRMALSNLGVALDGLGEHAAALNFHNTAIRIDPDNPESRTNRAISLLAAGDYPEGFREYEWRWKSRTTKQHGILTPLWDGTPFEGRTLLIHTEGGFGDVLQFARFIPMTKARGGRVVLRIRPELRTLLSRIPGVDMIVSDQEPVPPHDFQIPVLSLPLALRITTATIPFAQGDVLPENVTI